MPIPALAQTVDNDDVTINKLLVVPQGGQFEAGRQMSIQVDITSSRQDSILYIVQVKDQDGYTDYLGWEEVSFTGQRSFELPWTPQKEGRYIIQVFVWDGLSTPKPLSKASAGFLDVAGVSSVARCVGAAVCFSGTVTRITDGDTIRVNNIAIRLALVNTPERGEPGYKEATDFTAALCPVGSTALVDEDDGQQAGSYGRMVAKVFCGDKMLNAELLESGHAVASTNFCDESEFASEPWAHKYGCR
ncbi:thermonuclease family protein [Nitrososphaera viennensis]|uniref:Thermonuclease family protein n=1 Tax=Nitrososphaera viennensis TaxID=1034015 RepID=A0A977IFZ0_9ARCH|nr:thermonuclease family protein [Nitrososphaera viennensis]UVS70351.1 thermonuclease family protein [Nitrososphaera viennensis]